MLAKLFAKVAQRKPWGLATRCPGEKSLLVSGDDHMPKLVDLHFESVGKLDGCPYRQVLQSFSETACRP